jgi:hypothetical protein
MRSLAEGDPAVSLVAPARAVHSVGPQVVLVERAELSLPGGRIACDGWAVTKPRAGEWKKPTAWLRRVADSLWFLVFAVVFVIAAGAAERWLGVSRWGSGRLVGLMFIVVMFGAYFGSDVLGSWRERRKGRHKKRSH